MSNSLPRRVNGKLAPGGGSNNPRGRPKGIATLAREIQRRTGDGVQMVSWLHDVWMDGDRKFEQRMEALKLLLQYGFGKPVTSIELNAKIEGEVTRELQVSLREVPDELLAELSALREYMEEQQNAIDVKAREDEKMHPSDSSES